MMMPDKLDDRIRLVEEHVQAENAHDLVPHNDYVWEAGVL